MPCHQRSSGPREVQPDRDSRSSIRQPSSYLERRKRNHVHQLEAMGYTVTVEPAA